MKNDCSVATLKSASHIMEGRMMNEKCGRCGCENTVDAKTCKRCGKASY
jgi:ribosomal protein L40E